MALGLYTALPGFAGWDDGCAGLLAPALPVVGLILGALWAALTALARDFAAHRIFPHLDRLCIRAYPEGAASALARAGFARLMLDYVLYP